MRRWFLPGLLSLLAVLAVAQVAVAAWQAPLVRALPSSPSLSLSLSPSPSPSPSLSPSLSPTLSPSLSPSLSPTLSPSRSPSPAPARVRLAARTQRHLDQAAAYCRAQSSATRTCRPTQQAPDRPRSVAGLGCVCG